MLSERILNDPATYMKLRGYSPNVMLECAVCPERFPAHDGIAFPARSKDGTVIMAAFCCAACYLEAIPTAALWRA
jgi:hypothetical protein